MATNLAAACLGQASITIGSAATYTTRLDSDAVAGSYTIDNLVSDLNANDKRALLLETRLHSQLALMARQST